MKITKRVSLLIPFVITGVLALSACGGGSGGPTPPPGGTTPPPGGTNPPPGGTTPPPINQPPTLSVLPPTGPLMELSFVELIATAVDEENNTLAFAVADVNGLPFEVEASPEGEKTRLKFRLPKVVLTEDVTIKVSVTDAQGEQAMQSVTLAVNEAEGVVYTSWDDRVDFNKASLRFSHPALDEPLVYESFVGSDDSPLRTPRVEVSPDRRWLAYQRMDDRSLRVVAIDGRGAVSLLEGFGNPDARVGSFMWADDSRSLVFTADNHSEMFELYRATISEHGSFEEPQKISGELADNNSDGVPDGEAGSFWLLPNSDAVVFVAEARGKGIREIFVTEDDGLRRISGELPIADANGDGEPDARILQIYVSPHGEKVIFVYDPFPQEGGFQADVIDRILLMADVAIEDAPVAILPDEYLTNSSVEWSPTAQLAVARVRPASGAPLLEAMLIDALAPFPVDNAKIISGAKAFPSSSITHSVGWSPDGSQYAFGGTMEHETARELFVVPVNVMDPNPGANRIKVSGENPGGGSLVSVPRWSPDSQKLVFGGNFSGSPTPHIYVADLETTERKTVFGYLSGCETSNVLGITWSSDSNFLGAERGCRDEGGLALPGVNLYPVAVPDPFANRINIYTRDPDPVVSDFLWRPDASGVFFSADVGEHDRALFESAVDAGGNVSQAIMRVDGYVDDVVIVGPQGLVISN